MSLDKAIVDIQNSIKSVSPEVVIRVLRQSNEEATIIRAYASAEHEDAIKEATREKTFQLFTTEGLDIQVIFYDIATSLPPEEE